MLENIYLNLAMQIKTNMFIIYVLVLVIIIYLILTDNRFNLKRKIIFIIINIIFIIFSLIINKSPILIIKDLFWYSLILNISLIFHVLILDRIFYWAWKKRKVK